MERYEELKCSTCDYIPDEEDLRKTNYHLSDCSCGQKKVCDLCLAYNYDKFNDCISEKSVCPACSNENKLMGQNRKFWLQEEY